MGKSTTDKPCAPYVSFKTFQTGVQALRSHGLPAQLDRSVWGSKSGADQTALLGAFRWLRLIDSGDKTQPLLQELVKTQEASSDEKAALEAILRRNYADLFESNLETITPTQLAEAMGKYGSPQGSTRDRCIRFFLKAAEHCGIKVSGRLTARRSRTGGPSTRGNGKGRDRQQKPQTPATQSPALMREIELPKAAGTLTLSGTFNAFALIGAERELVYSIIDKMAEFEANTESATEEG